MPTPIQLTEPPTNTIEQCDAFLGSYMRAWDQVEIRLLPLLNAMLGTHQSTSLILLRSGINQPTLRNILEAVASIRLGADDKIKLVGLLRRWERASTKRNRIVHGNWMICIEMVPGPTGKNDQTKSSWVRFYAPADPQLFDKVFGSKPDEKFRSKHIFSLENIWQGTADVRALAADLEAFTKSIAVVPFSNPQPIKIDQEPT